jgi:putative transposase
MKKPVFPELYRNQIPSKPNEVLDGDITYIRIRNGFFYLAALLDACGRKFFGRTMYRRMDTALTLAALDAVCLSRMPVRGTCIHHSDRGRQYSNGRYRRTLRKYGRVGSMSAPRNPYENGQAESFMKTLKVE